MIILLIVMPLWAMFFNPNKYPHCLSSFHAMTGALDFMWPFNTSGWDVTPKTDDGTRSARRSVPKD